MSDERVLLTIAEALADGGEVADEMDAAMAVVDALKRNWYVVALDVEAPTKLFPPPRAALPRLTGKTTQHPYHCDADDCRDVCLVRCLLHSPPVPKASPR